MAPVEVQEMAVQEARPAEVQPILREQQAMAAAVAMAVMAVEPEDHPVEPEEPAPVHRAAAMAEAEQEAVIRLAVRVQQGVFLLLITPLSRYRLLLPFRAHRQPVR